MTEFYYSTRDYDIINNVALSRFHFLKTGQKLTSEEIHNPEFMDEIAKEFKGLVKRVDRPSWRLLAKNGHSVSAIRIYSNEHNVSLVEAKKRVDAFVKGGTPNDKKNHRTNEKGNNGTVRLTNVEGKGVQNEAEQSSSDISVNEGLSEV